MKLIGLAALLAFLTSGPTEEPRIKITAPREGGTIHQGSTFMLSWEPAQITGGQDVNIYFVTFTKGPDGRFVRNNPLPARSTYTGIPPVTLIAPDGYEGKLEIHIEPSVSNIVRASYPIIINVVPKPPPEQ